MTQILPSHLSSETSLVHRLRAATGVTLALCDQCGACSGACPCVLDMDLTPCRLVRLAQTGFVGFDLRVLTSETIWQCTGCKACVHHCPHEVDLSLAMAFFRSEAERLGLATRRRETPAAGPIHFEGRWSKRRHATPVD